MIRNDITINDCFPVESHSNTYSILHCRTDDWRRAHSRWWLCLQQCENNTLLVRPETIVLGRTYVLLQMFFFSFQRETSEMRRPIGAKFIRPGPNFIMPVQNLGGELPQKIQGPKTSKIWRDFGQLQCSTANIFGTDEDIQNHISIDLGLQQFLPRQPKKLGELWSTNFGDLTVESCPFQSFFGRPYFSPQGVLRPKIFTRAREWPSLVSAPPSGSRFFQCGVKNWLKIQRISRKIFGATGSSLMKLCHVTCRWAEVITRVQHWREHRPLTTFDFHRKYLWKR